MNNKDIPIKGQKVIFEKYTEHHWFTNILKDEKKFLQIGKEYTIKEVIPASSGYYVELEEIPFYDEERKLPFFNLWAFKWNDLGILEIDYPSSSEEVNRNSVSKFNKLLR